MLNQGTTDLIRRSYKYQPEFLHGVNIHHIFSAVLTAGSCLDLMAVENGSGIKSLRAQVCLRGLPVGIKKHLEVPLLRSLRRSLQHTLLLGLSHGLQWRYQDTEMNLPLNLGTTPAPLPFLCYSVK